MLLIVSILAFSCKKTTTNPTAAVTAPDYNPGTGWTLSWADEFDSTALNTSKWKYSRGGGGYGNQELQNYRSENVAVENGNLVITANRENYGGNSFTSGKIDSYGKYSFKYGKIVAKMKLPEGYGMWPAFWMLGVSSSTWPACGEIDILEMRGGDTDGDKTLSSTLHWSNASNGHEYFGQSYTNASNLSQAYHYYEVEWNATTIIARFDGIQFNETNITAAQVSELRDNNYYVIFNLAVGGTFFSPALTNPANVTAVFPQKMYVDWVRVYKN